MAGAVAMVKAFAAALVAPGAHVLTEFELHGFAQCALEELPEGIAGVAQQGGVVGVVCPRYDRVGHRVLLGLIEHSLGSLDGRLLFFPARRRSGLRFYTPPWTRARQALAQRGRDDELRWRDTGSDGAQPRAEGVPNLVGSDGC